MSENCGQIRPGSGYGDPNGDDLRHLLMSEAIHLAQLAVNFDRNSDLEAAIYYYQVLDPIGSESSLNQNLIHLLYHLRSHQIHSTNANQLVRLRQNSRPNDWSIGVELKP